MLRTFEAIIIKSSSFSEVDKMVSILTPKGRIETIAKGIRKSKSRRAGFIDLGNICKISLAKGRNFDILTEAKSVNLFESKDNFKKLAILSYILELTDKFYPERDQGDEIYTELKTTLIELDSIESDAKIKLCKNIFEIKILQIGGFLEFDKKDARINLRALKIINYVKNNSILPALKISANQKDLAVLDKLLYPQVINTLEREVKSLKLVNNAFKSNSL